MGTMTMTSLMSAVTYIMASIISPLTRVLLMLNYLVTIQMGQPRLGGGFGVLMSSLEINYCLLEIKNTLNRMNLIAISITYTMIIH